AQQIKPGILIDIASNDGTLLAAAQLATQKIAVDPANIKPRGADVWIQDYWEQVELGVKADTITAIACLYALPDPNAFVRNVRRHLGADGLFICQLMTLAPMIEQHDIANVCFEHLEYYSYRSLVRLFEQNGLEIFQVEENGINGGSYRL